MKDIKGYEGLYAVNEYGAVWSYRNNKFLKPGHTKSGYQLVNLYDKDGKQSTEYVHRIVAKNFLDNPKGYNEVNHKDENITNNHFSNLEWCDHVYNSNYGTKTKRMVESKIRKQSKLLAIPKDDNKHMRVYRNTNDACSRLVMETGKTKANLNSGINACINGRCKSAYGFYWIRVA